MSWLIRDEIVDLYNQKEYERAYWIDLRGETHFMGDMETSYLCNVMRLVGENRHLTVARSFILKRQFAETASWGELGPSDMNADHLVREMDDEFNRIYDMAEAPWETPLVQNLVRHIEARAWELRQ